jgi:hypothetical protein
MTDTISEDLWPSTISDPSDPSSLTPSSMPSPHTSGWAPRWRRLETGRTCTGTPPTEQVRPRFRHFLEIHQAADRKAATRPLARLRNALRLGGAR